MSLHQQRSRRGFLKQFARAATVAAFPAIVPAGVLGRQGNVAANERVHIGVIGTGGRGSHLAYFMPKTGRRAVNLCHLINICRELGRKVRWNPDRDEFVDDPAAGALLDRPRREGFEIPTL